jgi:hypothetical protein
MEGESNNNIVINWNNMVGQEARSTDNADLGRFKDYLSHSLLPKEEL